MIATLTDSQHWAGLEFGQAELGDRRRTERLVQIASGLGERSQGVLTETFDGWAELKGAYRFFSHPSASLQSIMQPHWDRTAQQCSQPGEYLLIDDGSELDYSTHRHTRGLGRIGNDRGYGMKLHTTLVARVESWRSDGQAEVQAVGLLGQQAWVRQEPSRRRQKEGTRQRMKRPRESQHWAASLAGLSARPAGVDWIYVADRESDIYEVFERCEQAQADWIIRAQHSRVLAEEDQRLWEAVASSPVLGRFELKLRARGSAAARTAQIEVRARAVSLRGVERPGGRRADRRMWVIQAEEINPPSGSQAVHWVLLSSLPADTFEAARRIIARYSCRWLIEEYHKGLKTGAGMEKSQLATVSGLRALLGVLGVLAVRLLQIKHLARTQPDQPVEERDLGPAALAILSAKFGRPREGWNNRNVLIAIARLGGFVARPRDGWPGWLTAWRGLQRLLAMIEGAQILGAFAGPPMEKCG